MSICDLQLVSQSILDLAQLLTKTGLISEPLVKVKYVTLMDLTKGDSA